MDFLPLNFQLKNKPCLIVGGGKVALRKANLLSRAGATIYVVAHTISADLKQLSQQSGGSIREGGYHHSDLDDKFLVIAATDDQQLNAQVSTDTHRLHIPINVVDQPQLCSFILPAVIDRSPLIISVSSGGKSPVLARRLKAKIESLIPASYGELANLLGKYREQVKKQFKNINDRRHFWDAILDGPIAEMVFSGKTAIADKMLAQQINTADSDKPVARGEVYLVGAGPGDPDLLTLKALRLMQKADVVLYDRLVADSILDLTRQDAEKIYVGKARANHTMPQGDVNQLLVQYAQQGKKVLRLKGGDPFIFGRGGEEIEHLSGYKIPFQVVPGITAASGCAAYAGIPLTHRDYAQSVRFVTGHLKDGSVDLNWPELVHPEETLVFYMGLIGLPTICSKLVEHGRAENTPIALIQQGTTANHKLIIGSLANMANKVQEQEIHAPTLIIVGEVVQLQQKLAWHSNK